MPEYEDGNGVKLEPILLSPRSEDRSRCNGIEEHCVPLFIELLAIFSFSIMINGQSIDRTNYSSPSSRDDRLVVLCTHARRQDSV